MRSSADVPKMPEAWRRYWSEEGQQARLLAIHLESANNELAMTWWSLHELRNKGHTVVPSTVKDPPDWRCNKCDRHPPVYGRDKIAAAQVIPDFKEVP